MGLIEPLAIATALPSGVLPFGSSLPFSVALVSLLGIAAVGLLFALPHRRESVRSLRLVHSTTA
jgi:hypothetical protein